MTSRWMVVVALGAGCAELGDADVWAEGDSHVTIEMEPLGSCVPEWSGGGAGVVQLHHDGGPDLILESTGRQSPRTDVPEVVAGSSWLEPTTISRGDTLEVVWSASASCNRFETPPAGVYDFTIDWGGFTLPVTVELVLVY